ncbi:DUF1097 domain-containing protein [Pandoraea commovens]|uniref:DUF1097 domain-containing protein n=1 Tax=Pandoraea commovens TaxID=2508289 RepID=A0A5E4RVY1_9BURK|nr:DUF1097 domain-containing protein [Pandoraea commovens]UVA77354.1 DUF1097 domain-containing protein [Pandoraea commovens]VVD67407.1 hypothetical protein PCO31010_00429 [Pandoraea commovens]
MKKLPAEVVASLLAVTTIPIAMLPLHLPPWAIFISWAATFAMGGPTLVNLKRIWATLPIGSFFAFLIVLGFKQAATQFSGNTLVVAEMVILFAGNGSMMALARFFPGLNFIPGMFFGFATYFATLFGGFGPVAQDPLAALAAAVAMNALGPVYAWLKERYSAPEVSHQRNWKGWKAEV